MTTFKEVKIIHQSSSEDLENRKKKNIETFRYVPKHFD
jgi:hypothetical protein